MPDLILFNGNLFSQDATYARATALAVLGSRIVAVGSDHEIRDMARPYTGQIDLRGRCVLPGLVDAHFHLFIWALNQRGIAMENVGALNGGDLAVLRYFAYRELSAISKLSLKETDAQRVFNILHPFSVHHLGYEAKALGMLRK